MVAERGTSTPFGNMCSSCTCVYKPCPTQVRKAKTFTGKTMTWRGVHSKSIRFAVSVLNLLERSDVTFLSRVPRKTATHLIFIHPSPESQVHPPTDATKYEEFSDQLYRTKKSARRDTAISIVALPFVAVFDIFVPLGLTEINLIWMAANIKAWRTAKSVSKRIGPPPAGEATVDETIAMINTRDHDGPLGPRRNGNEPLQVVFHPSPAMAVMMRYLGERCHKRYPTAFRSPGVADTEGRVLSSIGWRAERRGREHADEYDDVNVSPEPRRCV